MNTMPKDNTLINLVKKVNSGDVEELVLEAARDMAEEANLNGVESQIYFLKVVCGWGESDIMRQLGIKNV